MPESGGRAADTTPETPLASVIVPTRDRPAALELCLRALAHQSYEHLEIVVVDDGSLRESAPSERLDGARVVRGRGLGPAAARNDGAGEARGDIFCFTDDDCEPEPGWVAALVGRLRAGADAVAGTTLSAGGALADASELAAHAPAGVRPPPGSDVAFAPTNNLACTRAAFEATPFDESFPDAAGEDRDWCARLLAGGHTLASEPAARIVHRQRLTLRRFLLQQVRYGRGAFRFRRRSGPAQAFESPAFYSALLREGFRHGLAVGLLLASAQAATAAGYASGWWQDSRLGTRVRGSADDGASRSRAA